MDRYQVKYKRSRKGLTKWMYFGQIQGSEKRGHDAPNYTLEEFRQWCYAQSEFEDLYQGWVKSGYQKDFKPSADRLDDYKPYTLDNLRLVTFAINRFKYYRDVIEGINTKSLRSVEGYNEKTDEYVEFYSAAEASRHLTGKADGRSHIIQSANGKRKTAYGYYWQHLNN